MGSELDLTKTAKLAKAKLSQLSTGVEEEKFIAGVGGFDQRYTKASVHKIFPDLTRAVVDNTVAAMEADGYSFQRRGKVSKENALASYALSIEDVIKIYEYRNTEKFRDRGYDAVVTFLANLKGGASKTVSGVSLAQGLRTAPDLVPYDLRILVIDLDPQGSATMFMNHKLALERVDTTTAQAMMNQLTREEILDEFVFDTTVPGVKLMPASMEDAFIAAEWAACCKEAEIPDNQIFTALYDRVISKIKNDFDFIFVDTGPHIDPFLLNSLSAADIWLTPTPPDPVDLDSTLKFLNRLPSLDKMIKKSGGNIRTLAHAGFMTKFQQNKRDNKDARKHIKAVLPAMLDKSLPKSDVFSRCGETYDTVVTMQPRNYAGGAETLVKAKQAVNDLAVSFFEYAESIIEEQ